MKAVMEFHISRQSRDLYQFDQALFAFNGNVIFANFAAARQFAQKMNEKRDLVSLPQTAVRAGQVNAMGLIDELLHRLIQVYREEKNPAVMSNALTFLGEKIGEDALDAVLTRFCEEFPPLGVYRSTISVNEYLSQSTEGRPNREIALEELIMLYIDNANPAFEPFLELFGDEPLETTTEYPKIIPSIYDFFAKEPTFGPDEQNLIDLLRAPALAAPDDLAGQLRFLTQKLGTSLGKYLFTLLSSLDLIREEEKPVFNTGGSDNVPVHIMEFAGQEAEPEAFSPDRDWMPNLVLIAKNSYVWLDQLSKKYQRAITRLDQIPDDELNALARWGITGLWLIGLWERSLASRTIKQMRGNPEAVASAYSLMNYEIAGDLGGEEAYQGLREKCRRRGIRLASDMVPNHMGIDSNWVIEHPDWFLSLDQPPFPSYTFNGPNLSWDNRVGIYIEDHYFNNSDASVVFKRQDFWTGDTRYIYHGNDGTSMPWNDTAQLNYLLPQVREAVIQTILEVARRFPVIRFDAAMTLAKRHIQRLWFPEPGTGGDIASRAGLGLTKEQFDTLIPIEFWREVVDRVAQEVPDTLLLAEAFWMMEGYFVRTLGMHRVYNSAFMNMLRDEKNAEFRLTVKNTLEFDPEILKRYVNFMSNPDERTAVDQFGKGDKYFGVCTMMATLPGLPMIGHGQIEGFTEKYGMEYRRAYWDETPDSYLLERHEKEFFPLLRKRYMFAEVQDFLFFDFYLEGGAVNEDVFVFSNRAGDERSLVLYHNRFANVRGWIRRSAAYAVKDADGNRSLMQRDLAEGLGLENRADMFSIFTDKITGLEYIVNNNTIHEKGMYIELEAYKYHVFVDFRQIQDNDLHQYTQITAKLNGRGVENIEEAIQEITLQPILTPYRELVNAGFFNWLITNRVAPGLTDGANFEAALQEADSKYLLTLSEIKNYIQSDLEAEPSAALIQQKLAALLRLPALGELHLPKDNAMYRACLEYAGVLPVAKVTGKTGSQATASNPAAESLRLLHNGSISAWGTALAWLFNHNLGSLLAEEDTAKTSLEWLDQMLLEKVCIAAFKGLGLDQGSSARQLRLVKLLIAYQNWWQALLPEKSPSASLDEEASADENPAHTLLYGWLSDPDIQEFIAMNNYQDILWYNKESFDELIWWFNTIALINLSARSDADEHSPALDVEVSAVYEIIAKIRNAAANSGYQVEKLLKNLEE